MALPTQTPPLYPNVPPSSGVPAVFRSAAQAIPLGIITVAADAAQVFRMFQAPEWGLFNKGGQPIAVADSVVSIDFRREARISDYPLEQGAFETYDKVQMPFDVRVRFAVTNSVDLPGLGSLGMSSYRKDFLAAIDLAFKSLDLFTVITPDATYPSVNITHYDYRREGRNGATLLVVDVWCQEVRVNAQAKYSQTQQPEGDPKQDNGAVQGTPGTPAGKSDLSGTGLENTGSPGGAGQPTPPTDGTGLGPGDTPPGPDPRAVGLEPGDIPPASPQDFGGVKATVPVVNSTNPATMQVPSPVPPGLGAPPTMSAAEAGLYMIN